MPTDDTPKAMPTFIMVDPPKQCLHPSRMTPKQCLHPPQMTHLNNAYRWPTKSYAFIHHGWPTKSNIYIHHGLPTKSNTYIHHGWPTKSNSYRWPTKSNAYIHHGWPTKSNSYRWPTKSNAYIHHGWPTKSNAYTHSGWPTFSTACPMGMGGTHCDAPSRKVWMALGWQSFCTVWLPLQKKGVRFWPRACWFFSDRIFQMRGKRSSQVVCARSVLMWHSWVSEVR